MKQSSPLPSLAKPLHGDYLCQKCHGQQGSVQLKIPLICSVAVGSITVYFMVDPALTVSPRTRVDRSNLVPAKEITF